MAAAGLEEVLGRLLVPDNAVIQQVRVELLLSVCSCMCVCVCICVCVYRQQENFSLCSKTLP